MSAGTRSGRVVWTKHAKERRKEMDISEDCVERCMLDPEMTFPAYGEYEGSGNNNYQRDDLNVIAAEHDGVLVIVTVLYHCPDHRFKRVK